MTRISENIVRSLGLCLWLLAGGGALAQVGDEMVDVESLTLTGLERTNFHWLEGYIDYTFPTRMSRAETQALARKLMTTGVFTDVKVTIEPTSQVAPQMYTLHVHVEEKWTTIPVVRGVYGGGTPLRIFGIYDTHVLGRLLTLGGEVRKYGDAPVGYVVYARDPRSQAGRYWGAEFWRDFRRRQLLSRDGEELGAASTNAAISRIRMTTPFGKTEPGARDFRWKYGFDLEVIQEAPSVFDSAPDAASELPPGDLYFTESKQRQSRVLPTLLYDDVDVGIVESEGFRMKFKAEPTFAESETHGSAELELFGYRLFPASLNVAAHAVIGQTSFSSLQSQYFLGGLDSIRGIPDGAIYGTHAGYANLEVRHLGFKTKYLWFQTVAFGDAGGAGQTWDQAKDDPRSSAGVGVRFVVPQIYRMIFRIDYAWTTDGSGMQGVTAGMNQFFDPYTPLL